MPHQCWAHQSNRGGAGQSPWWRSRLRPPKGGRGQISSLAPPADHHAGPVGSCAALATTHASASWWTTPIDPGLGGGHVSRPCLPEIGRSLPGQAGAQNANIHITAPTPSISPSPLGEPHTETIRLPPPRPTKVFFMEGLNGLGCNGRVLCERGCQSSPSGGTLPAKDPRGGRVEALARTWAPTLRTPSPRRRLLSPVRLEGPAGIEPSSRCPAVSYSRLRRSAVRVTG